MKISIVINTYNADKFLDKVLKSLSDFDEIVVCDMHSTDKTLEIVSKYNCNLVFHEHTGIVEPARNYAISVAKNDWVLVLDADEGVTPILKEYLESIIKMDSSICGIQIPRKNYFMGRFISSSYPDRQLRFFKKNKVKWSDEIHSHPEVKGKIFAILAKRQDVALIHYANEDINTFVNKMNRYTEFEIARDKSKKYNLPSLFFSPFFRFFKLYILKGGIRDGQPGLIWAFLMSFYKFITISKALEKKNDPSKMDKELL